MRSEEPQEIFHIWFRNRQAAQFTGTVSQDFKTEIMFILTKMSSEKPQDIFHIGSRDRQTAQITWTLSQHFKPF